MVQQVVSNAMQAFVRLVATQKDHIAYARRWPPTAASKPAMEGVSAAPQLLDISSAYCQRLKSIVLDRLDQFDQEENAWQEVLVEDKHANAAAIVQTKLDVADWLASLNRRDRRVAEFLANGETTMAAARKFRVSAGRISQFAASWPSPGIALSAMISALPTRRRSALHGCPVEIGGATFLFFLIPFHRPSPTTQVQIQ